MGSNSAVIAAILGKLSNMNSHPTQVRAEMVATVHSLAVAIGDDVTPGTTLLILESMKMEIPVLAEIKGRVEEVAVAPGDTIQEGDLLIRLSESK